MRPQPAPHGVPSTGKRVMKQSWSYDWLGNTTASTDDASLFYERSLGTITNTGYRLTSAEQSSDGLNASYDAAGYLKQMDITRAGVVPQQYKYEWDEVGRLTKATRFDNGAQAAELTYAYDASDQRVRKSSGDRHSIYVFGSLELRSAQFTGLGYTVDDLTEVPYLFGHGVRLARVTYIGAEDFSLHRRRIFLELGDHLGSTSVVLDRETGDLVERSTAYAYGAAESHYRSGDWDKFREDYRFTGKEDDIEVGLIYFGARYLNPQLGRWISADPLAVHAPGEADLNLYAYVSGRALVAVDPVGLQEKTPAPAAAMATNQPLPPPQQAAYDQAVPIGMQYGKALEWFESWQHQFMDPISGGRSLWDTMSTDERAREAGKVIQRFNAVPALPEYSDSFVQTAAQKGFAHGMDVGYQSERTKTLATAMGFELLKLGALGAGAASDKVMLAMGRVVARAPVFGIGAGGIGVIPRVSQGIRMPASNGIGFKTFDLFKAAFGEYQGAHWHHIVEQNKGNISRFGAEAIHNTENMMLVDDVTHNKIGGFYGSIRPDITGSSNMKVREWLATKSFDEQHSFGVGVLKMFGVRK